MVGTYTFQRLNYIVMVIFMTPYLLTLFNLLGMGFINVAEERLFDTGIGSLLSFMASYLLFPHWESDQLDNYMSNVLKANINYIYRLADFLRGENISPLEYKLIRKEVFLSAANLSGAFNRMLSEPKSKQRNRNEIHEFVVLNNVLVFQHCRSYCRDIQPMKIVKIKRRHCIILNYRSIISGIAF